MNVEFQPHIEYRDYLKKKKKEDPDLFESCFKLTISPSLTLNKLERVNQGNLTTD